MISGAGHRVFSSAVLLLYRPLIRRAARQILQGRLLNEARPNEGRWLRHDVNVYVNLVWKRVEELVPKARLEELPTYGNRHNVLLAVITTAAYQVLVDQGVGRPYAMTLTADVGWKIYSWMLTAAAVPARMTTRDPDKRISRILRMLMVFPFSAPGAPGYEVKAWSEAGSFFTHWTHCPPQTFVRNLVAAGSDRGELDAFYHSWCLFDWAGADLLANDGEHGHYARPQTMSRGDSVCDMCWRGRSCDAGK